MFFSIGHNCFEHTNRSNESKCQNEWARKSNTPITSICRAAVVYVTSTSYDGIGLSAGTSKYVTTNYVNYDVQGQPSSFLRQEKRKTLFYPSNEKKSIISYRTRIARRICCHDLQTARRDANIAQVTLQASGYLM